MSKALQLAKDVYTFLTDNFVFETKGVTIKPHADEATFKELEAILTHGGLVGVVVHKFPEVRTNVLMPTHMIVNEWIKQQKKLEKKRIPKYLTSKERIELDKLKRELFKGDTFVVFSKEELESKEYKRYDELIKKKLAFLAYQNSPR